MTVDLCERFTDLELIDVVGLLGSARRTGALRMQGHPAGVVFVQDGLLVDSACAAGGGHGDRHATVAECLIELSRSPGLLEFFVGERSPGPRDPAGGVEVGEVLPLLLADRSRRAAAEALAGRLSLTGELTGGRPGVYLDAADWRWLVACVNGADLQSFARDFQLPPAAVAEWAARMVAAGVAVRDAPETEADVPPPALESAPSTASAAVSSPRLPTPRQASSVVSILAGLSKTATHASSPLVPRAPDSGAAPDDPAVRPDTQVLRPELVRDRPVAPAVDGRLSAPLAHPGQASAAETSPRTWSTGAALVRPAAAAPAAVTGGATSPVAVKVVVAGAFGAGKTTFISALSEIPGLSSETVVTDESASVKSSTTVAMDFGRIIVPAVHDAPAIELYLFGTPGQERFDFMWDIAARGMAGLVLMVDASAPDTWDDSRKILTYFQKASDAPVTIGMNRSGKGASVAADLAAHLGLASTRTLVPCQASNRESAKRVMLNLLVQLAGGRH